MCSLVISPVFAKKEKRQGTDEKTENVSDFSALVLGNATKKNPGEELLRNIITFLDIKTLCNLRAVSKGFDACVCDQFKNVFKDADQDTVNKAMVNAAKRGFLKLVMFLVADQTIKGKITNYDLVLSCAARNGHKEIVVFLAENETTKEKITSGSGGLWDGVNGALNSAASHGYKEIVEFLVENETTKEKMTPGCVTTFYGGEYSSWKYGVNTALRLSAANGHKEIVKLLVTNEMTKEKITLDCIDEMLKSFARKNKAISALLETFKKENFKNEESNARLS